MKTKLSLYLILIGFCFIQQIGFSQNAILDLESSSEGVLIPRMSSAQRNAIPKTAINHSLLVFDNDTDTFMFLDGNVWVTLGDVTSTVTETWLDSGTNLISRPDGKNILVRDVDKTTRFRINTASGEVRQYNDAGIETIRLDAQSNGDGSYFAMANSDGFKNIRIVSEESNSDSGAISLYDDFGNRSIKIDGDVSGDGRVTTDELEIKGGSDFAENFDIINEENGMTAKPGMLVSISPDASGKLQLTNQAYDKKLAGIISGANGIEPGLYMSQEGSIADGEYPVALTGRVYVYANTANGQIRPGDLLTSSTQLGYAMKVDRADKAQGAIIGKAMTSLTEKEGFVLVLVNLQ